jgi:hypothetical protein
MGYSSTLKYASWKSHAFALLTSNRISRLFWFGPGEAGIQKMSAANFLKEAKATAFRLRSPRAVEAKTGISKSYAKEKVKPQCTTQSKAGGNSESPAFFELPLAK